MKNTFYILLLGVLLTAVSCQKEDIQPRTNNQKSVSNQGDTKIMEPTNPNSSTDTFSSTGTPPINPTITDPNRDEDDEKKIKRD